MLTSWGHRAVCPTEFPTFWFCAIACFLALSLVDLFSGLVILFFLSFLITSKNVFNNYFLFFTLITFLFYFILSFSFFLSFFLPFILSRVDDRLLVLQPGVRAVPLRGESQVQDIGPTETSQLHVIANSKNLPEISNSTPRPSSTQRPATYSAGHPMPNN